MDPSALPSDDTSAGSPLKSSSAAIPCGGPAIIATQYFAGDRRAMNDRISGLRSPPNAVDAATRGVVPAATWVPIITANTTRTETPAAIIARRLTAGADDTTSGNMPSARIAPWYISVAKAIAAIAITAAFGARSGSSRRARAYASPQTTIAAAIWGSAMSEKRIRTGAQLPARNSAEARRASLPHSRRSHARVPHRKAMPAATHIQSSDRSAGSAPLARPITDSSLTHTQATAGKSSHLGSPKCGRPERTAGRCRTPSPRKSRRSKARTIRRPESTQRTTRSARGRSPAVCRNRVVRDPILCAPS